ncbi:MAG TPA: hypothetical protein VM101_02090 [Flavitalea sp.]|nr:hypothetical protein [Flavitalea sp.]
MTSTTQNNLDAIKDIRNIMERSSRFISLSGWSGVAAGICALTGSWVAKSRIEQYLDAGSTGSGCLTCLRDELVIIAVTVFTGALASAFSFTYIKSKKEGVALWGIAARRLLWNTLLPMMAGGVLIWKMIEIGYYDMVAPATLIFYGLALVNGSKYTMGEVRYLGYGQIITGIIALFIVSRGLYAWAFGFGILHIIYGITMWWKYERHE